MRSVSNLMQLMEEDQIYFWTWTKATIKEAANWLVQVDNPLISKRNFRKVLYWPLMKSMNIKRNEQFFTFPWGRGSCIMFHYLFTSAKGRSLRGKTPQMCNWFSIQKSKSCLIPNSYPQENSDLPQEFTSNLIQKALT